MEGYAKLEGAATVSIHAYGVQVGTQEFPMSSSLSFFDASSVGFARENRHNLQVDICSCMFEACGTERQNTELGTVDVDRESLASIQRKKLNSHVFVVQRS